MCDEFVDQLKLGQLKQRFRVKNRRGLNMYYLVHWSRIEALLGEHYSRDESDDITR